MGRKKIRIWDGKVIMDKKGIIFKKVNIDLKRAYNSDLYERVGTAKTDS